MAYRHLRIENRLLAWAKPSEDHWSLPLNNFWHRHPESETWQLDIPVNETTRTMAVDVSGPGIADPTNFDVLHTCGATTTGTKLSALGLYYGNRWKSKWMSLMVVDKIPNNLDSMLCPMTRNPFYKLYAVVATYVDSWSDFGHLRMRLHRMGIPDKQIVHYDSNDHKERGLDPERKNLIIDGHFVSVGREFGLLSDGSFGEYFIPPSGLSWGPPIHAQLIKTRRRRS